MNKIEALPAWIKESIGKMESVENYLAEEMVTNWDDYNKEISPSA